MRFEQKSSCAPDATRSRASVCTLYSDHHVGRHTQSQKEALHTHKLARCSRKRAGSITVPVSTGDNPWPRHYPASKIAGRHSLSRVRSRLRSVEKLLSPHAVPPTGIAYSLPEDKGSRPKNSSSNRGARVSILPFVVVALRCRDSPVGQSATIFR